MLIPVNPGRSWRNAGGVLFGHLWSIGGTLAGHCRDTGGTLAGHWRDTGGTLAGQWRDGGGTVAGHWRDVGGADDTLTGRPGIGSAYEDIGVAQGAMVTSNMTPGRWIGPGETSGRL